MHDNKYILFRSTRDVIQAEKLAKSHLFVFTIVPVPKHISAECGLCISIDSTKASMLSDFLLDHGINCTIAES
ncbi:MAG TPA: DUF3343 domain-containing protein [Bacteroidales bacterium]|nr:DUF3343 domain-containing protein [Bacteroidales bacterium]